MITQNIVFIGAGNMASALIAGLRHQGVAGEQIQVHAPSGARRDALAEEFGIRSLPAEAQNLPTNSVVIYAAKPKQISSVLALWRQAFADA
ncbi:MAG TPA: NAD(P)-binding domain-containing protein, partial [Acidithiobacillus sp.]|nr:NAD(P)-binding domain-containing protein [Acidithiobacillus sp.]